MGLLGSTQSNGDVRRIKKQLRYIAFFKFFNDITFMSGRRSGLLQHVLTRGRTPRHSYSVKQQAEDIERALDENPGAIDCKLTPTRDGRWDVPITIAVKVANTVAIEILVKRGADTNLPYINEVLRCMGAGKDFRGQRSMNWYSMHRWRLKSKPKKPPGEEVMQTRCRHSKCPQVRFALRHAIHEKRNEKLQHLIQETVSTLPDPLIRLILSLLCATDEITGKRKYD